MSKPAKLALEDGTVFTGTSIGADGEVDGEVCFNTSMTGYQEILTDPSYRGQIVTMTYPQIGNYGVNAEDGRLHRSRTQPHAEQFPRGAKPFGVLATVGHRCDRVDRHAIPGPPPALERRHEGRSLHN
jgi:hypothetical protein